MMWCCPLIALQQLRLQNHLKSNQELKKSMLGDAVDVNLSGRLLVEVPPSVCDMVHLRVLVLSHNYITHLPAAIGNVRLPSFSHPHSITTAAATPNTVQLMQLEELDVSRNELVELPDTIVGLQSLRTLNASFNSLQGMHSRADQSE